MDNVLTILIAVGGIAISLYMSAKKKEQEKAKRMKQNSPLPQKEDIFETVLMGTDWENEKQEKFQDEVQSNLALFNTQIEETVEKIKTLTDKRSEKPQVLFEDSDELTEIKHFNLKDAILYEAILKRKYI